MYKLVYKPIGYTPSMLIDELFQKNPELRQLKYSFFGKLDPMAHGLMVILFQDECHNKIYQNLDKVYQSTIVLGITTDTYDQMGKITDFPIGCFSQTKITSQLQSLIGKLKQYYPPYSYLIVRSHDRQHKRPLWWFAQNNMLDKVTIPYKTIEIYDIGLLEYGSISFDLIKSNVVENVSKVKGNFRQSEIIQHWNSFTFPTQVYFTYIKIKTCVSSGTYIRNIANLLNGFAYDIYRIQIGNLKL